ncbi:translation elongation factor Ts [bacterium (Candidatus Howlettbacteria) CG_4_10_14_0_8_um_filter_40_9]|nr:MAG: translation elongation factor Ts [bacterium (Candidatus Howlettbacteria) CG_4_10_14_0_8_um_filter_40_9]
MTSINAKDVAKLREMSGVGMMDCKKALEETGGDFDKAIELLRKKGAKAAEKRAGREAKEGIIVSYIHNGRVGVLLELNSETDFVAKNSDFKNLASEIALQIAAMNPKYISPSEIPNEEIEKEKEIEAEKMKESGKPADIIGKIVEGKIDKYYSEVCLLKQPFFKDEKKTVEDLINEAIAKIGEKIEVGRFARYEIGK